MKVGVISNCGGNVGSVISMLESCNIACASIDDPKSIVGLDGLILPGVGRFDNLIEFQIILTFQSASNFAIDKILLAPNQGQTIYN